MVFPVFPRNFILGGGGGIQQNMVYFDYSWLNVILNIPVVVTFKEGRSLVEELVQHLREAIFRSTTFPVAKFCANSLWLSQNQNHLASLLFNTCFYHKKTFCLFLNMLLLFH